VKLSNEEEGTPLSFSSFLSSEKFNIWCYFVRAVDPVIVTSVLAAPLLASGLIIDR